MRKTVNLLILSVVSVFSCLADTIPFVNTIAIYPDDSSSIVLEKAAHVVPSDRQLKAMRREFIAFIHFGPNTFTRREWGSGAESPSVFLPDTLDTDQWVRTLKNAGMKMVILTVKHHDGFVLWQSRYTRHGIMSSPFMDGKADVLRELASSCRKYGLRLGIYLSPADLYQMEAPGGLYGNGSVATERVIPAPVEGRPFADKRRFSFKVDDYNEYFLNQLYELLTEYGPVDEVWFDGAHPRQKGGQTYDYSAWKELIHTLAPQAAVFGREDLRWCGNEAGHTRDEEWNVIPYMENPDTLNHFNDMTAPDLGSRDRLMNARYLHYQPAETDVSIRDGWFYRDEETQRTRPAENLFDIYERSVGGNSIFLLNVPSGRNGKISERDSLELAKVGKMIEQTYGSDLLKGAAAPAEILDDNRDSFVEVSEPLYITLPEQRTFNRLMLQEPVEHSGERIESVVLEVFSEGKWHEAARSANVGYKRIMRFPDVAADSLRIRVLDSRLTPYLSRVGAYFHKDDSVASVREKLCLLPYKKISNKGNIQILRLEKEAEIKGIVLTPTDKTPASLSLEIMFSSDGKRWDSRPEVFDVGNLLNDKSQRRLYLEDEQKGCFVKIKYSVPADCFDLGIF